MSAHEALRFHVQSELDQLQKEAELLQSAMDLIDNPLDNMVADRNISTLILMGMASAIEKSYSGMERILKIVAENVDDYVPKGDTWHKSLIDQMAADMDSRSRIIGLTTAQGLHTLRAFRHRERNSYSLDLDKARVLSLGKQVFPVVESLKTDLRKLLDIPLLSDLHAKETGDDDSLQKLPFNQDGYFDRETRQILDKKQTANDNAETL